MLIEEKLLREVENSEQIQVRPGEVPDFDKQKSTPAKPTAPTTSKVKEKITTINQPNTSVIPPASNPPVSTTTTGNEKVSTTVNQPQIISAQETETLVGKGKEATKEATNGNFNFEESQVMMVSNGQVEMITKMVEDQLNPKLLNLLIGQKIYLQKDSGLATYTIESPEKMPLDLLNVFLKKVAILKKADGIQLFPINKGTDLPIAITNALK